jgi:osmotically inducible protein OsmC
MSSSSATATWEGGLRSGKGEFAGKSGIIQGSYSFTTRFEGAEGTNPEELIAAAHASCYSMALSAGLEAAGTPATKVTTTATATIDKVGNGFKITTIRLEVRGQVPGIDQAAFTKAAETAKDGCPVSQALKGNVTFELDARLA